MRSRWSRLYPVLLNTGKEGNGRETLADRRRTSSTAVRQRCWEALLLDPANRGETALMPREYRDLYRLDRYGNVVSILASPKDSICGFQVDHIFPWSRGGLTVDNNLAAVHWKANEQVKNDALLNANELHEASGKCLATRMMVGLSIEQFLGLIREFEQGHQDLKEYQRRQKSKQLHKQLQNLLTDSWALPNLGWGPKGVTMPFLRTLQPGFHIFRILHAAHNAAINDLMPQSCPSQSDSYDDA